MFSMLEARETVKDRRVLDLFAGTGALGIEALSRGAASAVCVERGTRECAAIRENAERAGVADKLTVLAMPVARAIPSLDGPFGLVFMDPPYDDSETIPATLESLLAADELLEDNAVIVVEQSSRNPADLGDLAVEEIATRRYGDTLVSLLAPGAAEATTAREATA